MSENQRTHYEVLGVRKDASSDAIKRAYRDLIRRYHPDRYAAEQSRMRATGDVSAQRAIDRKVSQAQKRTQQINLAYAVLSDPQQRRKYDETLQPAPSRTSRRVYRQADDGRRTTKQRPHRRQHGRTRSDDAVPFVLLGVLFIFLLFGSSLVSQFFGFNRVNSVRAPVPITSAPGMLSAADLQATTNAEVATRTAREELLSRPTPTPRGFSANVSSADVFFAAERYELAIEGYTQAIVIDDDEAELYYKRARAYHEIYGEQASDDAYLQAVTDYARALSLSDDLLDAYRHRGLLYFERYQATENDITADAALEDLTFYASQTSPDIDVELALAVLNGRESR